MRRKRFRLPDLALRVATEDQKTAIAARPLAESLNSPNSGKKKEPKAKLFGPDLLWWGGGLPREGVGAKKFGMSLETHGKSNFLAGYPGILPGHPGSARKV